MNVLVIGSGGREHTLAWKISQSSQLSKLYVLPGNPGTAQVAENIPISSDDTDGIVAAAIEKKIAMLCTAISRCERFEEQKASYIDYNLKLIEARYRRLFEAEEEAWQQVENGQDGETEEQEEGSAFDAEHASYELKWAGEKDAETYKRQLEQERRDSLAQRNKERAQHARVMEELQTIARERETESLVLKWAGENDAKAYLEKLEDERRQSLQLRGKQTLHHREVEDEQRQEELTRLNEDELLRAADQKDV